MEPIAAAVLMSCSKDYTIVFGYSEVARRKSRRHRYWKTRSLTIGVSVFIYETIEGK